jgi:hypothetical protein
MDGDLDMYRSLLWGLEGEQQASIFPPSWMFKQSKIEETRNMSMPKIKYLFF